MKITGIRTTPLLVPYRQPYYWSQGVIYAAGVVLVEVTTDEGLSGYGECIGTPSAISIESHLKLVEKMSVGRSPFAPDRLTAEAYHALFEAFGTCSSPRFAGQLLAGFEMALWDLMGKATGRAVHELLGGAVHDTIQYFGYPQGETAEEVAAGAKQLVEEGCSVFYIKVGRGDELDLDVVKQVRAVIGPNRRLRVDANEHWGRLKASRLIPKVAEYDIEFLEQPTHCESISALAQVRQSSPLAIAADQVVFTPQDAYDICCSNAADLIVLGLHETGGISRFRKAAHIAEAAGINICIKGLYETGVTTCAVNQAAATITNLDDGNQYMNHFLQWDIIKSPDLSLQNGELAVLAGPGLGFEIDDDAVAKANELYVKSQE